jgi:hypothetical protein
MDCPAAVADILEVRPVEIMVVMRPVVVVDQGILMVHMYQVERHTPDH